MKKLQYKVGDVVFVKCLNSDYWPAKIIQKVCNNRLFKVKFYNQQSYGFSTSDFIQPYNQQSIQMVNNINKHLVEEEKKEEKEEQKEEDEEEDEKKEEKENQKKKFMIAMQRAERQNDQIIRRLQISRYQEEIIKMKESNKFKQKQETDKEIINSKIKDKKGRNDNGVNELLYFLTKNDTEPLQDSVRERLVWTYSKKMFSEGIIKEIKQSHSSKSNKNKLITKNLQSQLLKIEQEQDQKINSTIMMKEPAVCKIQEEISQNQFSYNKVCEQKMQKREVVENKLQKQNAGLSKSLQDIRDVKQQYQKHSLSFDNFLSEVKTEPIEEEISVENYHYKTPPLKRKNKYLDLFSFECNGVHQLNLLRKKSQKKQLQLQLTRPLIDEEKEMFVFMNNYTIFLQELIHRRNTRSTIRREVIVSVVQNAVRQLYSAVDNFKKITEPQKFQGLLETLEYILQNNLISLQDLSRTIIPKIITFLKTFEQLEVTNKNIEYTIIEYIYLKAKYEEWLQIYETKSKEGVNENLRERTLEKLKQAEIKGL